MNTEKGKGNGKRMKSNYTMVCNAMWVDNAVSVIK